MLGERELCCLPGNMCLSRDLQNQLERRYGASAADSTQTSQTSRLAVPFSPQIHSGLRWYCPGDGASLNAELECPKCGKHLRDLVYVLVELHPHLPVNRLDERQRES